MSFYRQLDHIEALLVEIRDALKPPPLPAVPYEQLAAAMDAPPAYDPLAPLRKAAQEQQAAQSLREARERAAMMEATPYGPLSPLREAARFAGPTAGITHFDNPVVDARVKPWPDWEGSPLTNLSVNLGTQQVGPLLSAMPLPPGRPAGSEPSPLFAMLAAPLPGKAGPESLYPDPTECPGWPNENVTQQNIMQTIGVVGFTATIRPSTAEMGAMKAAYCKAHGIPDPTLGEWDHFISLELGGHPRDPRNLWWERYSDGATCLIGAREKDRVETALKRQIVSGALTLAEGQRLITTDWYASFLALNKMGMLPMLMTFDPSGDADPDDNA